MSNREEELKLKFVKFMGKYFCELALVFGAGTGPGIYSYLALQGKDPNRLVGPPTVDPKGCIGA